MKTIAFTGGDYYRGMGSIIKCLLCELININNIHYKNISIMINSNIYADDREDNVYTQLFANDCALDNRNNWIVCDQMHPNFPLNDMWLQLRFKYNEVLKRFFQPKEYLQSQINTTIKNMGDTPITIHYRGNDKCKEVTTHSPEYFLQMCLTLLHSGNFSSVFIATDSQMCFDLFYKYNLGVPLVYNKTPPKIDSKDTGMHNLENIIDKIFLAESTVIDLFCLAAGRVMVSGVSNFSDIAAILSPNMPWIYIR